MTLREKTLATAYAQAFEHVFSAQFSNDSVQRLAHAVQLLEAQRSLSFYLSLSIIPDITKEQALRAFFATCGCGELMEPLLKLLAHHKRLFLIGPIARQILEVYKESRGIVEARLKTAQPLTVEQQQFFKQHLSASTGKQVNLTEEIDQALIAGIRVQSATWVWEYSVAQQLRMIRASV